MLNMIARKQPKARANGAGYPPEVRAARRHLRVAGWSYRAAAEELGVHFVHWALVLTGKRESKRLITGVMGLAERD
jgi:hypothetical protein